jgi:hypothetical protein
MATIQLNEEPATPLVLILDGGPATTTDGDERHDARRAGGNATSPRQERRAARKLTVKNGADDCSGCGVRLMPGEMAFVWENAVVCGKCFQRRQAAHILAAVVARRMPGLAIVAEVARNGRPSWSYAARRFLRRPIKTTARLLRS